MSLATPARIDLLDCLRLCAALGVVCFHWFFNGFGDGKITAFEDPHWREAWSRFGDLGVDLFFLISGFVIAQSALYISPERFAVARAVRIYPAFLVAMLCTATLAAFWGEARWR